MKRNDMTNSLKQARNNKLKQTHLLIVGGGELEQTLKEKVRALDLNDAVTMPGMQLNVSEFLQAMDVFVFPSKSEGFGLSLVEAQASGLQCVASDNVPKETRVSDFVEYLNLESSSDVWVDKIVGAHDCDRENVSKQACESIELCGYNIKCEAAALEKIYWS